MGKAHWLKILVPRREFFVRSAGTALAIVAAVSAAVGIADVHLPQPAIIALIFAIFIVSALINMRSLISPNLVVGKTMLPELTDDFFVRVHCPCDSRLTSEAKKLAKLCFSATYTIAPNVYDLLRAKNPYILACMTDSRGNFLGYFDMIPVKETFALQLKRGKITEEDITDEDVLAADEMRHCKYLFIAGLAVHNPGTQVGARNGSAMVWAMLKYLETFYVSQEPVAFAVAATKTGDELLQKSKFNLDGNAADRRDKSNFYSIVITREEVRWRLNRSPDWTGLCLLDWAPNVTTSRRSGPRRPRLPKAWARAPSAAV